MPIITLNGVHVRTRLDPVSDYLQCACLLRLHKSFLPLQQLARRNVAFKHTMDVYKKKEYINRYFVYNTGGSSFSSATFSGILDSSIHGQRIYSD